jgi:membrane protease YdiL (CAAX protease family)/NAD-dependent dihydropyrimidine dehydrogenase PreA subunit
MSPARTTPLRLDAPACDGCGRCVPVCRQRAIRVGASYIFVDWAKCDGCGTCAKACDRGAIELRAPKQTPGVVPIAAPVPAAPVARKKQGDRPSTTDAKPSPKRDAAVVTWGPADAALVVITAFALLIAVQMLGATAVGPGIVLVAYDAVVVALLFFLARRHGGGLLAALRLDKAPEIPSVLLAVAAGIGCWVVAIIYRISAMSLGFRPPVSDTANLTTLFGGGALGAVATVLVVGVLGPLVEEAALRGVLSGALRQRFGVAAAVVAPAIVFAALHASVWSFIPLTVLGLALGWLSVRGRSLWPAVVAHVLYNTVLVTAALYAAARG